MSEASDLIKRMERETGQRIDANDGDNNAMAGCIGAIARLMGKTAHTNYAGDPTMDVPVGMYIKATSTPEYEARERGKEIMLEMFMAGICPDTMKVLKGWDSTNPLTPNNQPTNRPNHEH